MDIKEIILADGLHYAPAVVTVDINGDVVSGASAVTQALELEQLIAIEANTNGLLKNDTEVPFVWFMVTLAFTDTNLVEVLTTDIIVSYVLLNTTTGVGVPYTKRWRGWVDVIIPSPLTDYLVPTGGMPLTLAQMQSLGLATSAKQDSLLTELQLKADLTETQPVGATTRVCVSHQNIIAPITTGVTLASLCSGSIIPVGAVTAEIQALDNVVRCGLQNSLTVTPTTGKRINVDETLLIDSVLASVTLVADTAAECSVAFFDRV